MLYMTGTVKQFDFIIRVEHEGNPRHPWGNLPEQSQPFSNRRC
jgi:hypothetical protein